MHSHVVLYRAYAKNPNAADGIVREAHRWIPGVPGVLMFHAGKVMRTDRAVTNAEYDVLMNIIFKTTADWEAYVSHPNHMEFAKFMLRGYMLEGSTATDPESEFIDYVLHANASRSWVRNPAVPDNEVVWGGELGFDAAGGA